MQKNRNKALVYNKQILIYIEILIYKKLYILIYKKINIKADI